MMKKMTTHIPVIAIVVLAVLVHVVSFPGDYFVDDLLIVKNNPLVQFPRLTTIFTSDYWGFWANTGLYRPLTILSLAINRLLLGHQAVTYHLVNLILHIGASLLLYGFLRSLQGEKRLAWLAAALFAVHPIHGEPVNELVGRSELLVACFVLAALWVSQCRVRRQGGWVALCFVGALLSKEHGIVLLALLPAVDWYAEGDGVRTVLRRRWPLYVAMLALAAGWLWLRSYGLARVSAPPGSLDPIFVPLSTLDFPLRQIVALKLQFVYLLKLFVPYHLYGMYPTSFVLPAPAVTSFVAILIPVFAALLLALTWVGYRKRQLWGLALLLYAISCAPTANLFVLTAVSMADRLAYLSSVWFCLALATLLLTVASRLSVEPQAQTAVVAVVLLAYTLAGIDRGLDFRSPERLWKNDLRMEKKSELSLLFLANELQRLQRVDEAESYYKELITRVPTFSEGYRSYASFLVEIRKDYTTAVEMAKKSLQYAAGSPDALLPLAAAYLHLGRLQEAIDALNAAAEYYDFDPDYWKLRGQVLEKAGDYVAAMVCYDQERARLAFATLDVNLRRADLALRMKNPARAEKIVREELQLAESAAAWRKLAEILHVEQRLAEAESARLRAEALERQKRAE